jgi:hypothetical protein
MSGDGIRGMCDILLKMPGQQKQIMARNTICVEALLKRDDNHLCTIHELM